MLQTLFIIEAILCFIDIFRSMAVENVNFEVRAGAALLEAICMILSIIAAIKLGTFAFVLGIIWAVFRFLSFVGGMQSGRVWSTITSGPMCILLVVALCLGA